MRDQERAERDAKIMKLIESGLSHQVLRERFGISRGGLNRIVQRWREAEKAGEVVE